MNFGSDESDESVRSERVRQAGRDHDWCVIKTIGAVALIGVLGGPGSWWKGVALLPTIFLLFWSRAAGRRTGSASRGLLAVAQAPVVLFVVLVLVAGPREWFQLACFGILLAPHIMLGFSIAMPPNYSDAVLARARLWSSSVLAGTLIAAAYYVSSANMSFLLQLLVGVLYVLLGAATYRGPWVFWFALAVVFGAVASNVAYGKPGGETYFNSALVTGAYWIVGLVWHWPRRANKYRDAA